MVPLVTPCHVGVAGLGECDNCIPVVVLLGREAACVWSREPGITHGFNATLHTTLRHTIILLLEKAWHAEGVVSSTHTHTYTR